jgi:hypothetical protein
MMALKSGSAAKVIETRTAKAAQKSTNRFMKVSFEK